MQLISIICPVALVPHANLLFGALNWGPATFHLESRSMALCAGQSSDLTHLGRECWADPETLEMLQGQRVPSLEWELVGLTDQEAGAVLQKIEVSLLPLAESAEAFGLVRVC